MHDPPRKKDSPPQLSIVVATMNAEATLESCLESIFRQSFSAWELIIVDGGSTDSTLELISSHDSKIAYWRSQPDRGIYDAWNHALEHAKGRYVCFLGADDKLHSDTVLARIFATIAGNEYDLVTSRGQLRSSSSTIVTQVGNGWDYRKIRKRITICHPGALHLRSLFDRYGVFDPSYQISGDYEFLLRLPSHARTLHLDLVSVDIGDTGISRRKRWQVLRERFRIQAHCERIGVMWAAFYFLDKLWRIPAGRLLGIRN